MKKLQTFLVLSLCLTSCNTLRQKFHAKDAQKKDGQATSSELRNKPYETISSSQDAEKLAEAGNKKGDVIVDDRVFFGFDSNELNDSAKDILKLQVEWLKSDSSVNVIIEGHCDERGTREYNIALGEKRAKVVKDFLSKSGISPSRIKVISYGKEKPVYLGSDEDSWSKNRRAVTSIKNSPSR